MHSTVLKLSREGKYIVNNDRELLEKAVKELLGLSNLFQSLHVNSEIN